MTEEQAEMDRIMEIHRAINLRWDRGCADHEIMIFRVPESERTFWQPSSKVPDRPRFAVVVGRVSRADYAAFQMSPVGDWHSAPTLLEALRNLKGQMIESVRKTVATQEEETTKARDSLATVLRAAEKVTSR